MITKIWFFKEQSTSHNIVTKLGMNLETKLETIFEKNWKQN